MNPDNDNYIAPLSHYALLSVTGPDAETFLQGQLSCDMTKITEHGMQPAVYCSVQGRILASLFVIKFTDGFALLLPTDITESIREKLNFYGKFSKVTLEALEKPLYIAHKASQDFTQDYFDWQNTDNTLIFDPASLSDLPTAPSEYWDWQLISNSFPMIVNKTQDTFLPHRLNFHLLDALDFEKGCYIGQEIIARMHYRGKLKVSTQRCTLDKDLKLAAGTLLYPTADCDKPLGQVVNYCYLTDFGNQLLIELPLDTQLPTAIYIKSGETAELQIVTMT